MLVTSLRLACLLSLVTAAASSWAATSGNWVVDGNGGWNTPGNWSSNPLIPNGIGDTANLNKDITANRIVSLDVPVTLGTLVMQDGGGTIFSWTLNGVNALTLDTASANAVLTVAQGTVNAIGTDIVLNKNLTLNVNQGTALTISGNISGSGAIYRSTGANSNGERGVLTLTGNNTFLGDYYSGQDGNYGPLRIGSDTALGAGTVHLRGIRIEPYSASRSLANPVSIEANLPVVASTYGLEFRGAATLTGNRIVTVNNDSLTFSGGLGQNAAGRTLTKDGTGWLILGGTGSYSGTTAINAGVLRASDGLSLPSAGLLQLRGGVLEMSNTFSRTLGTAAGNVNWDATSSGGFSAFAAPATVNLNGGGADNLVWGTTPNFIGGSATLKFGSSKSDNVLTFMDNLDLGSAASNVRRIQVDDNAGSTADKTVLSGVLTGNGLLSKTGAGVLELAGANSFSGRIDVVQGQIALSGTGSLPDASQLNVMGGSGFMASGDAAANRAVAVKTLLATNGEAVVTVVPTAGFGTRLTVAGLTRTAPGTLLFRGTGLGSGAYPTASAGNIVFTDAAPLTLAGAGGAAGSTTISICPFARGDTSLSGAGTDLVTHVATLGVRPLSAAASEYATTITAGQTQLDNVRLSGATTVNGVATINALVLDNGGSLAGTSALTVNSGAILALAGSGASSKPLAFGAREGVIHVAGAATTATLSGAISGSGGLTKAGLGTLTLSSTTHTFKGPVSVSAGLLDLGSGAVLSNLYPPVPVHVARGATLRFPNNLYVGKLDGVGTIVGVTGNNIFRFGLDNADCTFGGTFTQTGGGPGVPGIDKLGIGTATIVASLGTLGSLVGVTDGTLRFYNSGFNGFNTTGGAVSTYVYGGALLLFDDTGTHVDDRTSSTFVGGEYKVLGNRTANTAAGGPSNTSLLFTLSGNPTLTLVPGTGFECQYRQRNGGNSGTFGISPAATTLIRGDGLGQTGGTRSRLTIRDNALATYFIGGAGQKLPTWTGGGMGTPQVSVLYRSYGDDVSTGLGSGFVTYRPSGSAGTSNDLTDSDPGARLLTSAEYSTTLASGDGAVLSTIANTKLGSAIAGIDSAARVNTLLLQENGAVAGTGTLTVESGLIMSTGSNGSLTTVGLATGSGGAVRLITPEAADLLTVGSAIGSGVTAGLIKSGEGTAVLTNANAYSGATMLAKGALRAIRATSVPAGSAVCFAGGVLESSGTFTRNLGTGGTQVYWDDYCSGGFAAYGGEFNIQLNNGTASVTWDNTASFVQGHRSLILGSATADSIVKFQNSLSLGTFDAAAGDRTDGTFRTIEVPDNPASSGDRARMVRAISGTDTKLTFVKAGAGLLELAAMNTYSCATRVDAGTLLVSGGCTNTIGMTVKSGATLALGIRGPTEGGAVHISGSLVFEPGATLTVVPVDGFAFGASGTWVIAYADGITGATVALDPGVTGTVAQQTIGGRQALVFTSPPNGTLLTIR